MHTGLRVTCLGLGSTERMHLMWAVYELTKVDADSVADADFTATKSDRGPTWVAGWSGFVETDGRTGTGAFTTAQ